jgi:hypothetical protein
MSAEVVGTVIGVGVGVGIVSAIVGGYLKTMRQKLPDHKTEIFVPVNMYDVTPGDIIFDESGTATRKNGQTMTNRKSRVNYMKSHTQDMSLRRRKSKRM